MQETNTERLLRELSEECETYRQCGFQWLCVHWAVILGVAVSGFVTATIGALGQQSEGVAWQLTLVAFGLISVVCAAINKAKDPNVMSESYYRMRDATKLIHGAIRNRGLGLDDAERLRALALKEPTEVIKWLTKWPGNPK